MNPLVNGRLPEGRLGQVLALLLLGLVLAAAWGAVAAPLLAWHAEQADRIERRTILVRRMAQIAADLPRLEQQATATAQAAPSKIVLLDGASDAVAGAALQQRLQDIAAQTGASLSSMEALPSQPIGGYRQVGVRVTVNAGWAALIALIEAVGAGPPQMLVDDLQVHGQGGLIRDADVPLLASMTVTGFRTGAAGP